MKNAKKFICFLVLGCVVCTHAYNVYQTSYAAEAVVVGGLSAGGVALLALGALAGVGMELDNNRRFNELSDEEKERIENGLASDFNEVALQRGASLEHIKDWTTDLCNGVLDKASECWGIFKDWIKSVDITDKQEFVQPEVGSSVSPSVLLGFSGVTSDGEQFIIDSKAINYIQEHMGGNYYGYIVLQNNVAGQYSILAIDRKPTNDTSFQKNDYIHGTSYVFEYDNDVVNYYPNSNYWATLRKPYLQGIYSSYPIYNSSVDENGLGFSSEKSIFKTNTDYLEKLKGQDEDVIDVIDVTDIKNPIIESRPNSLANINWNRGTRRTNNNNDDDNKMVTGLVPMDVWYEQIDDEQEQMQNAVVVYDNYIQEHPEEKDTYFISTTPITNINNYFNTLPVVNLPAQGTVVNNYYEYNNYNNNNTTVYELPYNTELVPQLPTMIFENKFPFCIPFDLYQFFAMFYVEKEAPRIVVPVPFKGANGVFAEDLTIDLSDYNYVSDVLRVMLYLLFIVGLMVATRRLIKG